MSSPRIYFVYGTLRPGGRYWSNVSEYIESYEPAFIDGYRLRHLPEGYPAVARGAQRVFGDLLYVKEDFQDLVCEIIDEIEGFDPGKSDSLYERIVVAAQPLRRTNSTLRVSAYIYADAGMDHFETAGLPVESGDWREYVAKHEELEP